MIFAEQQRDPNPAERQSNLLRRPALLENRLCQGASIQVRLRDGQVHNTQGIGALMDAYERLMMDLIADDRTLFTREDKVDIAWEHVTNILDVWCTQDKSPGFYFCPAAVCAWSLGTCHRRCSHRARWTSLTDALTLTLCHRVTTPVLPDREGVKNNLVPSHALT